MQQRNSVFCAVCADSNITQQMKCWKQCFLYGPLYNEGQLPLQESLETVVRRVRGWCDRAANQRCYEPGSRGMS
jgi:hypothetical protein